MHRLNSDEKFLQMFLLLLPFILNLIPFVLRFLFILKADVQWYLKVRDVSTRFVDNATVEREKRIRNLFYCYFNLQAMATAIVAKLNNRYLQLDLLFK